MRIRIKSGQNACMLIAAISISLLPLVGFAKVKPIMTMDLLQHLKKGEPWDRGVLTATKMVMFQQAASVGTDATSVAKITLAYFTSSNCTGSKAGTGFYTTPNGTSFPISVGIAFGLVAASVWNVGSTKLSIADMTAIHSIAVTFKSTNNNTPQANFSGASFACVQNVDCTAGPSGQCTSVSGPQSFTLKTTAAVGDPADGGVIGCQNTGTSFNLFDLVVTTSDQSSSQAWGGSGVSIGATTTGANSATDGAENTAKIVQCLTNLTGCVAGTPGTSIAASTYAAGNCSTYSTAGGFTSEWFLPSGSAAGSLTNSQLSCLYNNRVAIAAGSVAAGGAGFVNMSTYWSSTESSSTEALRVFFTSTGLRRSEIKSSTFRVRCTRAF
jgi:hypothetical protein